MLVKEKKILSDIDIVKDKDYIISELKKSEVEKSYSFEDSYNY